MELVRTYDFKCTQVCPYITNEIHGENKELNIIYQIVCSGFSLVESLVLLFLNSWLNEHIPENRNKYFPLENRQAVLKCVVIHSLLGTPVSLSLGQLVLSAV